MFQNRVITSQSSNHSIRDAILEPPKRRLGVSAMVQVPPVPGDLGHIHR